MAAPRRDELGWPDGAGRDHWPVYDPFAPVSRGRNIGHGLEGLISWTYHHSTKPGDWQQRKSTKNDPTSCRAGRKTLIGHCIW